MIVLTYLEGLRVLIIVELIKGTSILMILIELMVLTSQSFIIKEEWFCKKEDNRGGVLYTAMGSIYSWQAT